MLSIGKSTLFNMKEACDHSFSYKTGRYIYLLFPITVWESITNRIAMAVATEPATRHHWHAVLLEAPF